MDNWKEIAYLLGFGQGLILSISLIVRGINRQGRGGAFLGLILLVLSQELLNAWAMQVHYHSSPEAFAFWNFQSYLVLPIAAWFFVRSITETEFVFKTRHSFYFLPILLEIALRWIWQFCYDISERPIPSLLDNPVWFFLTEIMPIISMAAVLGVYGARLFRVWRKQRPTLRLYPRCFGLFVLLSLLTILWFCGVILGMPVFTGVEILLTICLFALGYIGYIEPRFFVLPEWASPSVLIQEKPSERPDFSRFNDELELEKLRSLFTHMQLHTRAGLTLDEASAELRLPVRYISYLVNTYCGTNFSGFVNAYRVEEVLSKLADPKQQHKTILGLALEAGFSSKSTFNQVFKQHTGHSPSQFLAARRNE